MKKWYHILFGEELEIKERLFRMILLVGTVTVTLAILQGLTLENAERLFIIYGMMLIGFVIAIIATFHYRNVEFASILAGIIIIVFALPEIFLKGGGTNSGTAVWLLMGIFYVFLMFSGKRLILFLTVTLFVYLMSYLKSYYFPEEIILLASDLEVHFDSFFAVVVAGITVGVILKFQIKVFEKERKINIAQKEELERISESKNVFFANLSHEIRTPINAVMGLNELILREDTNEEVHQYARNIQNASKMLLSLINDILDLSQLEMKQMGLHLVEYSTKQMFTEIVDLIQVQIAEKKLKFHIEMDKNIPSVLYGDEKRLKQILVNVLTNAVKYTQEGEVTLMCGFETVAEKRIRFKISIADTGIGIHKEDLESLFDAFQRVDKEHTNRTEGNGLGLAITKQLLDLMGGTITVDSIYTQGSVFTIYVEQEVVNETGIG
ncbi:MAG: fatty acid-binding protein DegV, partial [Lachnospiraceae bacterium]|nr:fatty acid-binding protein DegV [Lachnospiraceae bacterium]